MNVYLPAEAVDAEDQRRRFLDWRFLSALTVLILLAFLVYAGFRNYEARDAEASQKQALIEQLSDRADQIEALERDIAALTERAREDRREASRERAQLLRQQERMIRLLKRFGISPPPQAVSSSSSGAAPTSAGTGADSDPAQDTGRSSRRGPAPSPKPDSPGPAPSPPPSEPEPDLLGWLLPDLPIL